MHIQIRTNVIQSIPVGNRMSTLRSPTLRSLPLGNLICTDIFISRFINNIQIPKMNVVKYVGLLLDNKLSYKESQHKIEKGIKRVFWK